MFNNLSIGLRLSVAVVAVLVITVGVLTPVSLNSLQNTIATAEDRELEHLFKNVKASIKAESRLAQTLSAFVANIPQVQQAMAEQDRTTLANMLVPPFKVMKKDYGTRQFQFHQAPAISFLRVHKPEKHGDDLSSFRNTVVETNSKKINISGIEKGVAGLGVRGVVPMYYQSQHTGSVEFGMSFGQPFFENFKKLYNVEVGLYIKSDDDFKKFASTLEQPLLNKTHLNQAFTGKKVAFQSTLNDTPVTVFGGVITDFSDQPIGVLEMVMDRSQYTAALNASRLVNLYVGALCIALGLVLAWLISRAVVGPIKNISAAMHDIAEGEGDLTRRLPVNGKDEIAGLAGAFNQFAEKVRALVVDVSASTMQLSSAAEEMSLITDEANTNITRQRSEIEQVATAMNQMTATVQEVARNASTAATSARHADDEASQGRQIVGNSINAINALANEVERTAEVINKVEQDSESIGSVLDVIRGIAEQTNLLALNAAIEAARAGEQGRGFAVVADEVRTLASRTQSSTQEIHAMIERLQSGARQAVSAMNQGREQAADSVTQAESAGVSLDSITAAISEITDMNTQIASAAEEQSTVAEEINRNVTNINQVADQVTQSAAQTANAGSELASLACDLQSMVARFKT